MTIRHRLYNRHEKEFAALIPGGERTIASGSKLEKHDVFTAKNESNDHWRFRYELKYTQKASYSFKLKEWQDLKEYVALRGERPSWAIRFYGPEMDRTENVEVLADMVLVDLNDWVEILEELERLRGETKQGE